MSFYEEAMFGDIRGVSKKMNVSAGRIVPTLAINWGEIQWKIDKRYRFAHKSWKLPVTSQRNSDKKLLRLFYDASGIQFHNFLIVFAHELSHSLDANTAHNMIWISTLERFMERLLICRQKLLEKARFILRPTARFGTLKYLCKLNRPTL